MLAVFLSIFVAYTKIIFGYSFVTPSKIQDLLYSTQYCYF